MKKMSYFFPDEHAHHALRTLQGVAAANRAAEELLTSLGQEDEGDDRRIDQALTAHLILDIEKLAERVSDMYVKLKGGDEDDD